MTIEIWKQLGLFTALVVVLGVLLGWGLAKVGSDFQREFEQEQDNERSERRRF